MKIFTKIQSILDNLAAIQQEVIAVRERSYNKIRQLEEQGGNLCQALENVYGQLVDLSRAYDAFTTKIQIPYQNPTTIEAWTQKIIQEVVQPALENAKLFHPKYLVRSALVGTRLYETTDFDDAVKFAEEYQNEEHFPIEVLMTDHSQQPDRFGDRVIVMAHLPYLIREEIEMTDIELDEHFNDENLRK